LTALELDAAKVRVMKSAAKQPGLLARKKGSFMKSRVALVAILALGVLMSGTGASLAVSGFANNGSASSAQYPEDHKQSKPHHIVEAANSSGGSCSQGTSASENCNTPAPVETQAVRQVAVTSSSSSLPFTGFLAVPVLIVGLGLLGAGVAMRIVNRRGNDTA
jgi:hypothetical protein